MDVSKLKVAELKEELTNRGLSTKGLKAELAERLEEALKCGVEATEVPKESEVVTKDVIEPATEPVTESPKKRRGRSASIDCSTQKITKLEEQETEKVEETETVEVISEQSEQIETVESEPAKSESSKAESVKSDKSSKSDKAEFVKSELESVKSDKSDKAESVKSDLESVKSDKAESISKSEPVAVAVAVAVITETQNISPEFSSCVVHVSHLTRPFTLNEFKSILSDFGTVQDVWLDSLKSQSFVTFADSESASKCQEGLNGKQFPESTGKNLSVSLCSLERMEILKRELEGLTSTAIGATLMNTFNNSPESQSVPLEELFKRTETEPSIYYLPKQ